MWALAGGCLQPVLRALHVSCPGVSAGTELRTASVKRRGLCDLSLTGTVPAAFTELFWNTKNNKSFFYGNKKALCLPNETQTTARGSLFKTSLFINGEARHAPLETPIPRCGGRTNEAVPPPLPERAVLRRLGAFPPGGRVSARTFRPATAAMAAGLLLLRVSRRLLAAAETGRLVPGSAPRREKKRWLRAYLEQQRLRAAPRRR